jgi:hypothetical protein
VAGGRFVVRNAGNVLHQGTARPGCADGSGPGFIDVLQWVPRKERVCAVIRDGKVIATQSLLMKQTENDEELLALIGQRDEAREFLRALDDIVESVTGDTWVKIAVDHVRKQTIPMVERAYLGQALRQVPDDRLEETIALMRDKGLYRLLNYDRPLIEGFAALSLCCSTMTPYKAFVAAFLERRGLSLEQILAAADRLHKTYGVGRVWQDDEVILPSI